MSAPQHITDHHGRMWERVNDGSHYTTYRHHGMRWTREMVENPHSGLPSQAMLDNPNYAEVCAICLNGRERHITPCRPEWNCEHVLCREVSA